MKLWEILSSFTMARLEKWEHDSYWIFSPLTSNYGVEDHRGLSSSKPRLISRLCHLYYANIRGITGRHLDLSENRIVQALAAKPYGTSHWSDLETEMGRFIRPSTFANKISSLGNHGLVFGVFREGARKKSGRDLVIPDEILPQVRKTFKLPPQVPDEHDPQFGVILTNQELEDALNQIPEFSLLNPDPDVVLELTLAKDSGKKGVLQVLATATFRDLHDALQRFAGWDDDQLHEFIAYVRVPERIEIIIDGLDPTGHPVEFLTPSEFREDQVQVGQFLSPDNNFLSYYYDFGDSREVVAKVTRVLPRDPNQKYPKSSSIPRKTKNRRKNGSSRT